MIFMDVDYNELSKKYDAVRYENKSIIHIFMDETEITAETRVLDFGCGTGNYAHSFQRMSKAKIFGVEPSDGMREKARTKNAGITIAKGNHEHIPFDDSYFDFVYMTDVIHHVPDIEVMFCEIGRVLKHGGKLCIVTESHKQIDNRFYVKYFPSTAIVDKKRYPDIDEIIEKAVNKGFKHLKTILFGENTKKKIDSDFVELVRNKGFSMFHLIPDDEFIMGLKQLESDVAEGNLELHNSGETLVWLQKRGAYE